MKTYIIGEMAWGHSGSYKVALKLLHNIKNAKADAIGIHLTNLETYMTKNYKCLAGQTVSARDESIDNSENIYDYLTKISLTKQNWLDFNEKCIKLDIDIVAMCNDIESFEFSKSMNVKKYVIAASSFYEYDYIKEIVKYNNDLIIRIGGASLDEIDDIVNFVLKIDSESKINLLAGIQLYPTPINSLEIKSIKSIKNRYKNKNVSVGLADHINGSNPLAVYLPGLALAYDIETIEKHITTDIKDKYEDFEAALGKNEFKEFVEYIRNVEIALGDGSLNYLIKPDNEKYKAVLRKKIVAFKPIKKGETITKNNITFKRSDEGAELQYLNDILGKKINRNVDVDEGINIEFLK